MWVRDPKAGRLWVMETNGDSWPNSLRFLLPPSAFPTVYFITILVCVHVCWLYFCSPFFSPVFFSRKGEDGSRPLDPTHYPRWHPCKSQPAKSKSHPANTKVSDRPDNGIWYQGTCDLMVWVCDYHDSITQGTWGQKCNWSATAVYKTDTGHHPNVEVCDGLTPKLIDRYVYWHSNI